VSVKVSMEEGVFDVELLHGTTPRDGWSQHSPNGGGLHDEVESLIVVHPRSPGEPTEDPTSPCINPESHQP
jgi:hypothetical protein